MTALLSVDHVKAVCRVGQGAECCRYLTAGGAGFECAKHSWLKAMLDYRADAGTMTARGDNCEGRG